MKECYLCGVSEEMATLYEGIHKSSGFVTVCRKCYFKDKIPLVDKKEINLEEINKRESVRERLSRLAHLDTGKKEKVSDSKVGSHFEDSYLKSLVEKNFKKEVSQGVESPTNLVYKFNWVIMRKRRSLKITKKELAEKIREPVVAIESLENGILPLNYEILVKKIEGVLGIKILKDRKLDSRDVVIESKVPSGILVSDLREIKEEDGEYLDANNLSLDEINKVYGIPNNSVSEKREFIKEEGKKEPKDELSGGEIDKLIWGK